MSGITGDYARSVFWSQIAEARAARDADTSSLGVDALPPFHSDDFGPAQLQYLLEHSTTDPSGNWVTVGSVNSNLDTLAYIAANAPLPQLERIIRKRSDRRPLPKAAFQPFAQRFLAENPSAPFPNSQPATGLRLLALALLEGCDLPDLLRLCLYYIDQDTSLLSDEPSLAPSRILDDMSAETFRQYLPQSAQVLADWFAEEVSDVAPRLGELSDFRFSLATLAAPLLPANVVQAIARMPGEVLRRDAVARLVAELVLFSPHLDPTGKARLLLKIQLPLLLTLKQGSRMPNFFRLLRATGFTDPAESPDSPSSAFAYPSAAFVDLAASQLGDTQPFTALLRASRGQVEALPFSPLLDPSALHWILASPHVTASQVRAWLAALAGHYEAAEPGTLEGRPSPRLPSAVIRTLLDDGATVTELLPFLSTADALRTPPDPEFSELIIRHAFARWSSSEQRLLRLGDRLTAHLQVLDFYTGCRAVLDAPFPTILKATHDDSSTAEVLISLIDRALADASPTDLSNLHTLSSTWQGSIWELMCVADITLPASDPTAPAAATD